MAEIIPPLNRQTLAQMTPGEKRFAQRIKDLLEDDYLVWYDIPVGENRRYPDFIILHPGRGLLVLEVKDWKPSTLRRISATSVTLLTANGEVKKKSPSEQARECAYEIVNKLAKDKALRQSSGAHRGNLIMPYGWGVVFTNISRRQIEKAIPDDVRERILPDHLTIYQDEMTENADPEKFQEQLWNMFNYQFGNKLSMPQIDRVRWHLFPEIRIGDSGQADLFSVNDDSQPIDEALPDIIKIMDIQQEQLARSLGEGHRVIHGVAGSGKTLILGYRCLHLAQLMSKPILVLCFNISLASKLRAFISSRGIGGQVQVYHFHDWCGQQLKTYHVDVPDSGKQYFDRQVEAVISATEKGQIPKGQYGAVLIDEGQDFQEDWLRLVAQIVDPETNSLLLLYDDAQSIYRKKSGLGFSLSSVGIQAKGRTTILRLNYRNTREILHFAYAFARSYIEAQSTDEDHIPLISPEAAGKTGPEPVVRQFYDLDEEISYTTKCLAKWHEEGIPWGDMAVMYVAGFQGEKVAAQLKHENIPIHWLAGKKEKMGYSPDNDKVSVMTIHSSKGLEFNRVVILGIGHLSDDDDRQSDEVRLLYVGMTRAQEALLMTTSKENVISRNLLKLAKPVEVAIS